MAKILFKGKQVDSKKKIVRILKGPKITKIVDNPKERNEVISQFKKYKGGGITKDEARKILGKFYYDKNDSLDRKEAARLAEAFGIEGVHKYKRPTGDMILEMERENRVKNILEKKEKNENSNNVKNKPSSSPRRGGYVGMGRLH